MTVANELFPNSPRVIYKSTPLTNVVCQIRFPPILRIESNPPADFQDRIRAMFPLLERRAQIGLLQGLPPEFSKLLNATSGSGVVYAFQTKRKDFTLTLVPDALALTTTRYDRWEGFKDLLAEPLNALIEIYKPSFFGRIGLRYQNAIQRTALKLEDQPWANLLNQHILGILAVSDFEPNILEVRKTIRATFPDGVGSVFLQHGFGGNDARDRSVYLLDFDLYSENIEVNNAIPLLDDLHTRAGRGFRWCISPFLHRRLGPSELDGDSAENRTYDVRPRNVR
jgi:uncharacterized protein (TIGR04255 family)